MSCREWEPFACLCFQILSVVLSAPNQTLQPNNAEEAVLFESLLGLELA
jgi:hypothetical protein